MARKPQIGEQYEVFKITNGLNKQFTGKVTICPYPGKRVTSNTLLLNPLKPSSLMFLGVKRTKLVGRLTVKGVPYSTFTEVKAGDRVKASANLDNRYAELRGKVINTTYDEGAYRALVEWFGGYISSVPYESLFFIGRG